MSNFVYEDKMYNEEKKIEFMGNYKESTRPNIERIFKVSQTVESSLDKDLYSFSREQLRKLLFLYMPKTVKSSSANCVWINAYISWALDESYATGTNPLVGIPNDWSQQFVVSVKLYWTDKEINKIIDDRVNAQDAIIPCLLFEGVRGTANTEITNLIDNDVDAFNHKLHLVDSEINRKRTITVGEKCIKLCEAALKENEYEKKNGDPSPDTRAPIAPLVYNRFVVKSVNIRTTHFSEAEKNVVHRRLSSIAKEIGEPNFTPMNIVYSGMISKAKDAFLARGYLDDEDLKQILAHFGEDKDYDLAAYKAKFLNETTIKSLYGLT